jgi:hypothetical protein
MVRVKPCMNRKGVLRATLKVTNNHKITQPVRAAALIIMTNIEGCQRTGGRAVDGESIDCGAIEGRFCGGKGVPRGVVRVEHANESNGYIGIGPSTLLIAYIAINIT